MHPGRRESLTLLLVIDGRSMHRTEEQFQGKTEDPRQMSGWPSSEERWRVHVFKEPEPLIKEIRKVKRETDRKTGNMSFVREVLTER